MCFFSKPQKTSYDYNKLERELEEAESKNRYWKEQDEYNRKAIRDLNDSIEEMKYQHKKELQAQERKYQELLETPVGKSFFKKGELEDYEDQLDEREEKLNARERELFELAARLEACRAQIVAKSKEDIIEYHKMAIAKNEDIIKQFFTLVKSGVGDKLAFNPEPDTTLWIKRSDVPK